MMTPRYKDTHRTEAMQSTRLRLLDAAAAEFAHHGFDGANVNTIAAAAGFSVGTLYNYFPTKRDLMDAFIDDTARMHVASIAERVGLQQDPSQRVAAFFQAGFDFVTDHPIRARAIFNTLNGPDEAFRERLFQGYQPLFQLLAEGVIAAGIARRQFRQLDPLSTASLMMLIYLGTASQFSPQGGLWMDPDQVSDFVLHSLRDGE